MPNFSFRPKSQAPVIDGWIENPDRINGAGGHSRVEYEPDDAARRLATNLSGIGVPKTMIAKILGVSRITLERHLGPELDLGMAQATAIVCNKMFNHVLEGSLPATMFWLKARADWVEAKGPEDTSSGDDFAKLSDEDLRAEIEAITARQRMAGLGHTS